MFFVWREKMKRRGKINWDFCLNVYFFIRFNKKIGNEHMLFHASRFSNWVGILSRGILLPDAVTKLGIPRLTIFLLINNYNYFFV